MIRFLLKGLLRDRSRSLFPVLIISAGVALTVFLHAWMNGAISSLIQSTAHFRTGHVRVMTKGYAARADQLPNDLALLGVDTLLAKLRRSRPELYWTPRIAFGGLLDIPNESGETTEQAPVSGIAADLLSANSPEWKVLNLQPSLVQGRLPQYPGDLLIGEQLAKKLCISPGRKVTLISSTMYGGMAFANFVVSGTVRFGVGPMDRSAIIADLADMRRALDMQDGAGEILGFFRDDIYHEDKAEAMVAVFNSHKTASADKFSPVMGALREEAGLSDYLDLVASFSRLIVGMFIFVMSLVLWNAGLTGALRRYGEFGLRLAVGEEKGHVYRSLIVESLAVGIVGSTVGTLAGAVFAYWLQAHGLNIGALMKNSTMMITDVVRAEVGPMSFAIGFFPGIMATILGSAISGIGIYKRQTSQLFKELET